MIDGVTPRGGADSVFAARLGMRAEEPAAALVGERVLEGSRAQATGRRVGAVLYPESEPQALNEQCVSAFESVLGNALEPASERVENTERPRMSKMSSWCSSRLGAISRFCGRAATGASVRRLKRAN